MKATQPKKLNKTTRSLYRFNGHNFDCADTTSTAVTGDKTTTTITVLTTTHRHPIN